MEGRELRRRRGGGIEEGEGEGVKGWKERVREVIIPRSSHFHFLVLEVIKSLETAKCIHWHVLM